MKIKIDPKNFPEYTYPRQAVLITVVGRDNIPNIMTVSWHSPLSRSPPLYGISILPKRYSHNLILDSKEFVVNHAPFEIVEKVHYCGRHTGRDVDKFKEAGLTDIKAKKVKPPIIKECYAHFECKLSDYHIYGDHTWFVGEVVYVTVDKKFFEKVKTGTKKYRVPLMHQHSEPVLWLGAETYSNMRGRRKNFITGVKNE